MGNLMMWPDREGLVFSMLAALPVKMLPTAGAETNEHQHCWPKQDLNA
jgi:hypothetical protein